MNRLLCLFGRHATWLLRRESLHGTGGYERQTVACLNGCGKERSWVMTPNGRHEDDSGWRQG